MDHTRKPKKKNKKQITGNIYFEIDNELQT